MVDAGPGGQKKVLGPKKGQKRESRKSFCTKPSEGWGVLATLSKEIGEKNLSLQPPPLRPEDNTGRGEISHGMPKKEQTWRGKKKTTPRREGPNGS